ncbi:MAG: hypothetical protein HQK65_00575 [Desulfamplus sp.]|nr:hypothetical protein [Desulfamplus sp.]
MGNRKKEVSYPDKIKVYINSGGKCSFPSCNEHLVEDNTIIGEIAHINALSENGPRYIPDLSLEELNHPNNLLALCTKHHTIVDNKQNEASYPEETLKKWKSDIELWAIQNRKNNGLEENLIKILLSALEIELDRGQADFVSKSLTSIHLLLQEFNAPNVEFEFEILKGRALQNSEKILEAQKVYESLNIRYPKAIPSRLYLAEIHLNQEDFQENEKLLNEVEKIESDHWLLHLEYLIRKLRLMEKINTSSIDEKSFPKEKKRSSDYYRIYSAFYCEEGNFEKANEFIEKAIVTYPNKFSNYITKLTYQSNSLLSNSESKDLSTEWKYHLDEIESSLNELKKWGEISARNTLVLNILKCSALIHLNIFDSLDNVAQEILNNLQLCDFDFAIDNNLTLILTYLRYPKQDLETILTYIKNAKKKPSDHLCKTIFINLCRKDLFDMGIEFYNSVQKNDLSMLITFIQSNLQPEVLNLIKDDPQFMYLLFLELKEHKDIRKVIIEKLTDDGRFDIKKLWLKFYFDIEDYEQAFIFLKQVDLSDVNYAECRVFAEIAHQIKAWDIEIELLERLLLLESDDKLKLNYTLGLLIANYNLSNFNEVKSIGIDLLKDIEKLKLTNENNPEGVLGYILQASIARDETKVALSLLESYIEIVKSPHFKIAVEVIVYIKNNDAENALKSIVDGAIRLGHPTEEEYGYLYFHFIQIDNLSRLNLDPFPAVENNSFVKISDRNKWYYVGNECELDATKIDQNNENYQLLIGKKLNDTVEFSRDKYSSKNKPKIIENILPIERYINTRARESFFTLSSESRWNVGWVVEVPHDDEKADFSKLKAFLEDQSKSQNNFFESYCKQDIPFALLTTSEGSVFNALGKVQQENKGFIRLSDGSIQDSNIQKQIAKNIFNGQETFLDGTSAIFLTESGFLEKIIPFIPNLKIPNSVIQLLFTLVEKLSLTPGQVGTMEYVNEKIYFNEANPEKLALSKERIKSVISILEKNPNNILNISNANKSDSFIEQRVPPEVSDACIYAQKYKSNIISDDYLYLQANALLTKKEIPTYCSSFILVKTLFEEGHISFDDYLDYFHYIASYRGRFLPISSRELIGATFGHKEIFLFNPNNLKKYRLDLVLSEEYGVSLETAIKVLAEFFGRVLIDDSITQVMADKVFNEVVPPFLKSRNRIMAGKLLVAFCRKFIEMETKRDIVTSEFAMTSTKLSLLEQTILEAGSDIKIFF